MNDHAPTTPALAIEPLALSGPDAARPIGVSARTFRRLDSTGQVPQALRVGGSKRWSVAELSAWLSAGAPNRARWEGLKENAVAACEPRRRRTGDQSNGSTQP